MSGDCAHHAGEFRPSPSLPMPTTITPSPLPNLHPTICPGSLFIPIHRLYNPSNRPSPTSTPPTHPFFQIAEEGAFDLAQAKESVSKLSQFDARDDVFVVMAHDKHLLDVVSFFPQKANQWREEGWKEEGRWMFLGDFEEAVKVSEEVGREGKGMRDGP